MGVKKCIYKVPGSQKQYCKCNGTMMDIASFRKLKKAKLVGKKAKNPVKVRRGGENDDSSDFGESDPDPDFEGGGQDEPDQMTGGKKMSKKGGDADEQSFNGGKKMSKKGGDADEQSFNGGKKMSKKGGEADDHSVMAGKKMSKKGGVADFNMSNIGFEKVALFADKLNDGFKEYIGGKKSKKGGENCNSGMKGGNAYDKDTMMGGKKVRRGGNDIVMEGGSKSSRRGGNEYADIL